MSTMRTWAGTPGRALPGLLAAVVMSVVLGIIGMHALSTHGVVSDSGHGGHATMSDTTPDAAVGTTAPPPAGQGEGDGHDTGGMVMLCAAMLAGTAAALLLLTLGLRHTPRVWAVLPAPAVITGWVTSRRATGPPPAWEFSVLRC